MDKRFRQVVSNKAARDDLKRSTSSVKPHLARLSGTESVLRGVVVERVLESAHSADQHSTDGPARHVVVLPSRNPATLTWRADGRQRMAHFAPGDIIVNPRGNFVAPSWSAEVEFILVGLEAKYFEQWREEHEMYGASIAPAFHRQDDLLSSLAKAIMLEVEQSEAADPLYLDSLTQAMVAHLSAKYGGGRRSKLSGRGELSRLKVRRIHAYMQDHLSEEVRLSELAREAGLSASHFVTCFRRATGQSPHQYLVTQRIERAKTLLKNTQLSLAEIALRTGFSDQSHLTRMMRRHAGATPRRIRES